MILDKIVERKKQTLKEKKFLDKEQLIDQIKNSEKPKSFHNAIKKSGLSIIGEVKKASPSKGLIKEDFRPQDIAREYEKAVDAISVLTEEHFFMGSPQYLKQIKSVTSLPILRKDFIIDEKQIYEARILGASCVLLITAILDKKTLKRFIDIAYSIDMDALVEVHTEEEVYTALGAGAKIIGINNRNLKDFSVDLNNTLKLKKLISDEILVIGESGIHNKEDIQVLKEANINGVLVGESFMKCDDIMQKAKEFKDAYED
ncbi:indole-3-glycerol phosphate synthase TrpC [Clostridium aestuarii]|uniref:Indole-3-glycerol phosphate synthase n=1 Tax=Clostridium aestuarii TaxID=338193 RepID=A0ABT4CW44_9CLOT|nr:indole-3-glycerol phosphate synthase TrpC [Clostridium aestuarii]MCY6483208.1 indole-3-glycerol phosphate synthase TrpC [Clostridium aestuarii]